MHECGHALAALEYNCKIQHIVLCGSGGKIYYEGDIDDERRIIISFAGPMATEHLGKWATPPMMNHEDYEIIHSLSANISSDRIDDLHHVAKVLVRERWKHIEALAHLLQKRRVLMGDDIKRIIKLLDAGFKPDV